MRPLRGLQETRVLTREESGVLGFPSRRATSPGSLASQRHPGKIPKVPGRRRGTRGFPAAPRKKKEREKREREASVPAASKSQYEEQNSLHWGPQGLLTLEKAVCCIWIDRGTMLDGFV